jgi:long-chain acyl-CoA synthetase
MLVSDILEQAAEKHPDRPAVWCKNRWKTYRELKSAADKIASSLIALGVEPGDRIALLLDNSFDYICAHFGVLRAGAVDVSLNTELKSDELNELLADCEAQVLIAETRFLRGSSEALRGLPELRHIILSDEQWEEWSHLRSLVQVHMLAEVMQSGFERLPQPQRIDIDLASIVYTSGVTGKPKGVMLSNLNLVSNADSIVQYLGLNPEDRMMVVLPFYYIYGRSLLYTHFLSCGSLVIDNRFAYPTVILNTMQEQEVTCLAGVPSTYSILLNKSDLRARKFPRLKFVTQAGGGMPKPMQKAVAEAFHPARLFVMYGSTEAAPRLTYVEPEILPSKWGSIGRAIPNVEVIVADEEGRRLPPHVAGEIAARGSNIMMGYWKDSGATAQVLRHGYYYTGDLGYADEDGYIFLTGRSRDIIKVGGHRVSAKEIEDLVAAIPGVLEAAVIGVSDELLGEAIKVLLVPASPELNVEFVKSELKRRLPVFKQPKWVEFHHRLPKNQSGKILKAVLIEEDARSHSQAFDAGAKSR